MLIGTLLHRAKTICSSPQHLQREEQHLTSALKKCKYPTWALNRIQLKNTKEPANKNNNRGTKPTRPEQSNINQPHIVVPHHQGLSENFKRTCSKYGIQVHLKGDLPSETSSCPQKIKIQSGKREGSYIDTNATGWTVKKNTLVSQQEILQRGLKNT